MMEVKASCNNTCAARFAIDNPGDTTALKHSTLYTQSGCEMVQPVLDLMHLQELWMFFYVHIMHHSTSQAQLHVSTNMYFAVMAAVSKKKVHVCL